MGDLGGESACYAHLLDVDGNLVEPPAIAVERIYGTTPTPGLRVLVDRVWPRGVKRGEVSVDLWLRDVAPSDELRRWFGHDPAKWTEFERRYRAELERSPAREGVEHLASKAQRDRVVLLFGARDEARNQAQVLKSVLLERAAHP